MDEAWKLFEGTGKVTDYLNYCRNKNVFAGADNREDEEKRKSTREEEKETGWDKMLY